MQKRSLKAPTKSGKIEREKIRTAIRALHVMPPESGEGWVVTKSGDGRLTERFASKQDALEFGQSIARQQKATLIIHGRDGRIRQVDVYRHDPNPPRDGTRARHG